MNLSNKHLEELRKLFNSRGFDLRFVGGCVRDSLIGIVPADIDLCTDANPNEQLEIYQANNIRHILTGMLHGTITVILDDKMYEITSLRLDVATDGRRATVAYTRDWIEDLARRDFTFNAMQLTFDNELIDPFNGKSDLENGIVKFVGNAEDRIKEDYLRILRWFRFFDRFGNKNDQIHFETLLIIKDNASGLASISKERIWMEYKKILSGNSIFEVFKLMNFFKIHPHIFQNELSYHIIKDKSNYKFLESTNPITRLVGFFGNQAENALNILKSSSAEINMAKSLIKMSSESKPLSYYIAVENVSNQLVVELAMLKNCDNFEIELYKVYKSPRFPLTGIDAFAVNIPPGPAVGRWLKDKKEQWYQSGMTLTREELLEK